jgi:hypothetical protein
MQAVTAVLGTASALLIALLIVAGAHGQQKSQLPPFVPGELIVKFSSGGKAKDILTRAAQTSPEKEPRLTSYLAALSREVSLPLQAKQVTAGGELVILIERRELVSRLSGLARNSPHVLRACESATAQTGALPAPTSEVLVEFRADSPPAQVISRVLERGLGTHPDLEELTQDLERDFGHKLGARVEKPNQLILVIGVDRLTMDLAERLSRHPDVEYAQPNFVLKKLPRAPRGPGK